MSFIEYIKKELNIAALIVLLGFAGNVLAYVYKAAYFYYFKIPISMISFAFHEIVLYSVGPIIIGLLQAYAHWITKAPESELAKIMAKHYLKRRIRVLNVFMFTIGTVIICAVQWYITQNLRMIPVSLVFGLVLLTMASFLFRDNFKKSSVLAKEEKRIKKEDKRQQDEINAYRAKRMKTLSNSNMGAEDIEEKTREEIASANTEFEQVKTEFKEKIRSVKIVLLVFLVLLSMYITAILGKTSAEMKVEYSLIVYQNTSYVCVAEYHDHFICTMYDQTTNNIVPGYRLIPFTEAELIMSRRIGSLSVSKASK